uniref:HECT domain-containing protein n=3 Tax=Macrostomum lignano TaxID=282301 RepID=A0A1I8HMT7_9PLAT
LMLAEVSEQPVRQEVEGGRGPMPGHQHPVLAGFPVQHKHGAGLVGRGADADSVAEEPVRPVEAGPGAPLVWPEVAARHGQQAVHWQAGNVAESAGGVAETGEDAGHAERRRQAPCWLATENKQTVKKMNHAGTNQLIAVAAVHLAEAHQSKIPQPGFNYFAVATAVSVASASAFASGQRLERGTPGCHEAVTPIPLSLQSLCLGAGELAQQQAVAVDSDSRHAQVRRVSRPRQQTMRPARFGRASRSQANRSSISRCHGGCKADSQSAGPPGSQSERFSPDQSRGSRSRFSWLASSLACASPAPGTDRRPTRRGRVNSGNGTSGSQLSGSRRDNSGIDRRAAVSSDIGSCWRGCCWQSAAEDRAETGAEDGAETGAEDGAETGTEDGAETVAEDEAETGADEAETGAEDEAETGAEDEAETGAEDEAETGAEDEAETGAEDEAETGAEDEAETGAEDEAETGTEDGAETGAEDASGAGAEDRSKKETDALAFGTIFGYGQQAQIRERRQALAGWYDSHLFSLAIDVNNGEMIAIFIGERLLVRAHVDAVDYQVEPGEVGLGVAALALFGHKGDWTRLPRRRSSGDGEDDEAAAAPGEAADEEDADDATPPTLACAQRLSAEREAVSKTARPGGCLAAIAKPDEAAMPLMSDTQSRKSSQPQTPVPDGAQEPTTKEQNFLTDKTYLLSTTNSTGINLYEHLVTCLRKILEERPRDVVDIFEDISKECKRSRLAGDGDSLRGKLDRSTEIALAEIQKRLFNRPDGDDDEAMGEDDADPRLPNLLQLAFFFEQGGVGIDKDEIYRIWLSLKKLVDEKPIEKLRFWGKVLGTEQNYYVAEVEFREGEGEEEAEEEAEPERDDKDDEEGEEEETEDDTPKPNFKPAPPVPKEEPGTGANKYAYFVCNEPGKAWIRLPNATPAQIHVARRIKKFFTGRLDAPIVTYPPFPGTEANYLRAQIARISAGTHVSPKDFYTFGEEEEEEEDGVGHESCAENPEYEPPPVRALADPEAWAHHVLHILPQGRTRWWNPVQIDEDEELEDEEEEKEEQPQPQPEVGPPLLTSLSEDAPIDGMQPWTVRLSSGLVQRFAVTVVSSNLWPGAHAVASGKVCENIYIGWGHKFTSENYSPAPPPPVMAEFVSDPELKETDDPTPEEEAALKALLAQAEEGEEEGYGDEEGGEDDD